jgi:hypothetical protein
VGYKTLSGFGRNRSPGLFSIQGEHALQALDTYVADFIQKNSCDRDATGLEWDAI